MCLFRFFKSAWMIFAIFMVLFASAPTVAGMLTGQGTGYFDSRYSDWEIEHAPACDFNNSRIRTFFIVDNPDDPKAFYGILSFGHAIEDVCKRVSRKELKLIKSARESGDWEDLQLGFGITAAISKSASPAVKRLYDWYTDEDNQDKGFSEYVAKPILVAKDSVTAQEKDLEVWRTVLEKENLIINHRFEFPTLLTVGEMELEKAPDLAFMMLTSEETAVIRQYITDVLEPFGQRLEEVAARMVYSTGEADTETSRALELANSECLFGTQQFISRSDIPINERAVEIIASLMISATDNNNVTQFCRIHSANVTRLGFLEATRFSDLSGLWSELDSKPLMVLVEGVEPGRSMPAFRNELRTGVSTYQSLISRIESEPGLPLNLGSPQDAAPSKLHGMHVQYLNFWVNVLTEILGKEFFDQGQIAYLTLEEQEATWLRSLNGQTVDFLSAYGDSKSYAYFSETNTGITTPLFMDALARGWPGDKLLGSDASQPVSSQISDRLRQRFGDAAYQTLITRPQTCFSFSADGKKADVRQAVSGETLLLSAMSPQGRRPVYSLDPWYYRSSKINKPEASTLIETSPSYRSDCEKAFAGNWPVFEHTDGRTVKAYYGTFDKPVAAEAVSSSTPAGVTQAIGSIREKTDFKAMKEFEQRVDADHGDDRSVVAFERHGGRLYSPFGWVEPDAPEILIEKMPYGTLAALPADCQDLYGRLSSHPEAKRKNLRFYLSGKPSRARNNLRTVSASQFSATGVDVLNESELPELVLQSEDSVIINIRAGKDGKAARAELTRKLQDARERFPGKRIAVVVCEDGAGDAKAWLKDAGETILQNGGTLVCLPSALLPVAAARRLMKECQKLSEEDDRNPKDLGEFMNEAVRRVRAEDDGFGEGNLPENFLFQKWVFRTDGPFSSQDELLAA